MVILEKKIICMHLRYIIWSLYINAETKYNPWIQISTQHAVTCNYVEFLLWKAIVH